MAYPLLHLALATLVVACGGTTIVDEGGGGGGGADATTSAGQAGSTSTGAGKCWPCSKAYAENYLDTPFCPGADKANYDALFACGCEKCLDAGCDNNVDSALCSDIGGYYGGIGSACRACLQQECPDEHTACKGEP